jgi:hypothetical protein
MTPEDARRRHRLAVAIRLGIILTVTACGAWLVLELDKSRRAQNCLESGNRKCAVLDVR